MAEPVAPPLGDDAGGGGDPCLADPPTLCVCVISHPILEDGTSREQPVGLAAPILFQIQDKALGHHLGF